MTCILVIMKVAITLNTSWNIYNFRMGLVRRLIAEGNTVLAVAPYDAYSKKIENEGCDFVPIEMDNTGSNPFKDFSLLQRLKKIYRQHRPDIILNFTVKPNIYGTLAAHSLKIPVINNVSGLGTVFLSAGLASFVAKKLYRKAFSVADFVFFQNKDDREEFISQIKIPNLQSGLVPGSGINLDLFKPGDVIPTDQKVFLLIARLIIDKGIVEYIEAARLVKEKYPESKIQLLGKLDPDHARGIAKEVIDKAHDENIIEYLGETEDVRPFIERASCVVLPSYREGTPRTLLEAAALGRAILTTDVPGCREVVEDGETGLLCHVKSARDLADKMKELCELTSEQLSEMGKKGRKLVESRFDEQLVIRRYLDQMSNIINQIPTV